MVILKILSKSIWIVFFKITFSCHNELGDYIEYILYVEVMGKHSNIILVGQNDKIIDCIKHISPSMNSERFFTTRSSLSITTNDKKT